LADPNPCGKHNKTSLQIDLSLLWGKLYILLHQ